MVHPTGPPASQPGLVAVGLGQTLHSPSAAWKRRTRQCTTVSKATVGTTVVLFPTWTSTTPAAFTLCHPGNSCHGKHRESSFIVSSVCSSTSGGGWESWVLRQCGLGEKRGLWDCLSLIKCQILTRPGEHHAPSHTCYREETEAQKVTHILTI